MVKELEQAAIVTKTATVARAVQIANLIRENQLISALVLFVLWQAGAFYSAQTYAAGVMC